MRKYNDREKIMAKTNKNTVTRSETDTRTTTETKTNVKTNTSTTKICYENGTQFNLTFLTVLSENSVEKNCEKN